MRSSRIVLTVLVAVAVCAGTSFAMKHEASADKGKALFNDPKLGTTGKTCNDCHPNGKGLEMSGTKEALPDIVNGCIAGSIKGKALKDNSVEMQSLILYIKSVGKEGKTTPKKSAVGC